MIAAFIPSLGWVLYVGNKVLIISARSSAAQRFLFESSNLAIVKKLAMRQEMSTLTVTTDWSLRRVTGVITEKSLPSNELTRDRESP